MVAFMNPGEEDIAGFEKCRNCTASIIECNKLGLQLAHSFAETGFRVICVDRNRHALEQIEKGIYRFKGNKSFREYVQEGALSLSTNVREAASKSDIILVAASPVVDRREKPDYAKLERISQDIGMGMTKGCLVVFANTTGPGKVEGLLREIIERSSGLIAGQDFGLASSPLQIVSHACDSRYSTEPKSYRFVGGLDEASLDAASQVLRQATSSEIVRLSSIRTAEILNLFHKARIATSCALANEFALLCDELHVDFLEVADAAKLDNVPQLRLPGLVSNSVHGATRLLLAESENLDLQLKLTASSRKINDEILDHCFRLTKDLLRATGRPLRRSRVSILGISGQTNMKSPPEELALRFVNLLKKKVGKVQIYDGFFSKRDLRTLGLESDTFSKVIENTDCVIILVGHSRFSRLNLRRIMHLTRRKPAILDLTHVLSPSKVEKQGFIYRGLGRGAWIE